MKIKYEIDSKGIGRLMFGTLFTWIDFPDTKLARWLHDKTCSRVALTGFYNMLSRHDEDDAKLILLHKFISATWGGHAYVEVDCSTETKKSKVNLVSPVCTSGRERRVLSSHFPPFVPSPKEGFLKERDFILAASRRGN